MPSFPSAGNGRREAGVEVGCDGKRQGDDLFWLESVALDQGIDRCSCGRFNGLGGVRAGCGPSQTDEAPIGVVHGRWSHRIDRYPSIQD